MVMVTAKLERMFLFARLAVRGIPWEQVFQHAGQPLMRLKGVGGAPISGISPVKNPLVLSGSVFSRFLTPEGSADWGVP